MSREVGVDGDLIFNGFKNEEQRLDKITIQNYRKMRDTDATLDGLIKIVTYPILAAGYGIKADDDDVNEEQAEFIRRALFEPTYKGGMETPFSLVLDQMLHAIYDGFALFERVYKLDNDGRLVIKKMARRDATTLTLIRDSKGGYGGARQQAQFGDRSVDVVIPSYKTFLFTYDKASDYLYGRSILRSAYRNWDKKRKIEYFDSVAIQSRAIKPKILKRISDALVKGEVSNSKALAMLAKLGEFKSAMSLPYGYDVSELEGGSNDGMHEAIERQNSEMARSFLANFMLSGSQGSANVGSYNLSTNQSNLFMLSLKGLMNLIVEHINAYWIADLIDLNYPVGQRHYPEFYFEDLTSETADFMKSVFNTLIQKDKVSDDLVIGIEQQVASRLGIDADNITIPETPELTTPSEEEVSGQSAGKFPSLNEDPDDEDDSSESEAKPVSTGVDPAVLEAEKRVNFKAIEKFLDKTEHEFEDKATPILQEYCEYVAKHPTEKVELPDKYVNLIRSTYLSAYNYGKLSVCNELGEKAPKTIESQNEHADRYVSYVIQKQTSDIENEIELAKTKLPVEVSEDNPEDYEDNTLFATIVGTALSYWLLKAVSGVRNFIANSGLGAGRDDAITIFAADDDLRLWSSRMEPTTCATCAALNRTTYTFDQWNELEWKPGDVHFKCRCIEILMRRNSHYELPEPTGMPSDLPEIDHMRVTTKGELQKQGLVGDDETKKAAVERKLYNQVDNGQTLSDVESATREADVEYLSAFDTDMNKIAELTDNSTNSVSLPVQFYDYYRKNNGSVMTHNHPGSRSFSEADFDVAIAYNVNEMRVSSRKYTYILKPGDDGWPSFADLSKSYKEIEDRVYSEYEALVRSGKMKNGDDVDIAARHDVNQAVANEFGLIYTREEV